MNKITNFVFIIGAMKCGTSSLFEYLGGHPEIAPCSLKEPCFFSSDSAWEKGLNWYYQLWQWDSQVHKIALEASVDYTKVHLYPDVARKISNLQANCKFIYILRNPLDRIESHYIHGLAQGWGFSKQPLSKNIDSHLIETSKYAKQIETYYKFFSADNILLLNFEDLKQEPQNTLTRICQFLDINPNYQFQGLNTVHNPKQGRKADSRLWLTLSKISTLRSLGKIISSEQKQAIRRLLSYEVKSDTKLSEKQQTLVLQELKDDLYKLNYEYGFDLSAWHLGIEN